VNGLKAELTFPPELIDEIAEKVVERLTPLFQSECNRNMSGGDKYLTVKTLSDYIGFSKSWIYNNLNKIPHHMKKDEGSKKGKPLFRKSEIDGWLEKYRESSQQTATSVGSFRQQKLRETTSS
jgi:predicted DNA-binding transcriptional regulator AlpA